MAISSGDFTDVGGGGLPTAGGVGFLPRSYGLTIDHVKGAEVVLTDGRVVRADADTNPTSSERCAEPAPAWASSRPSTSRRPNSAT
ncbi:FAD-binding protein [Streptomyces sp. MI02-7b]|uniref:FAD-binding protein n=1 Tax=Streptomyces sp. MI02-7b TaxID=462941 RepID=UPI0029AB9C82|nr:FAD-binding protein [Streptomyces sp. MI02-7b]MDX3077628.1 FAD-binding protein [Streptomyces sp. MI02-7b]